MRTHLLCLMVALVATPVAAAQPEPCTPPRPGAWVPMSVTGGPELGEVADVNTGFLGGSKWWFWDAFKPLSDSRVYDVRCNAWRRTTPAPGTTLPKRLARRYGVLFGATTLAVHSATWETDKGGTVVSGALGLFVLDGARLEWTNLTPTQPLLGAEAQVVMGEGLLVAWDAQAGRGAIFTLATKRWEPFTERPPLIGKGYDCSWLQGGAWLIANPQGVFRFDLSSKQWSTLVKPSQPIAAPDLGGCLLSPSSTGLTVAMPRSPSTLQQNLFVIEAAGTAAWELPAPGGSGLATVGAAGNTLWHTTGLGTGQLQRYDRGKKRWVSQPLPKSLELRRAFLSEVKGQAMLVELSPAQLPLPIGQVPPEPKPPEPTRAFPWNGKSFGKPLTLETEPVPPRRLAYRGEGPEALIAWGEMETRVGTDCDNPFHPRKRDPTMPVCDPSGARVFTRISPGGFVLLKSPVSD